MASVQDPPTTVEERSGVASYAATNSVGSWHDARTLSAIATPVDLFWYHQHHKHGHAKQSEGGGVSGGGGGTNFDGNDDADPDLTVQRHLEVALLCLNFNIALYTDIATATVQSDIATTATAKSQRTTQTQPPVLHPLNSSLPTDNLFQALAQVRLVCGGEGEPDIGIGIDVDDNVNAFHATASAASDANDVRRDNINGTTALLLGLCPRNQTGIEGARPWDCVRVFPAQNLGIALDSHTLGASYSGVNSLLFAVVVNEFEDEDSGIGADQSDRRSHTSTTLGLNHQQAPQASGHDSSDGVDSGLDARYVDVIIACRQ